MNPWTAIGKAVNACAVLPPARAARTTAASAGASAAPAAPAATAIPPAVAAPTRARAPTGLSLQHRQGRVAILSPVHTPRTARLAGQLNAHWPTRTLLRPALLVEQLRAELPQWRHDLAAQQALVAAIARGTPPVAAWLGYWANQPARRTLTTACLFDMPMDDVLALLEPLGEWPGKRVLLQGSIGLQHPLLHPALDASLIAPGTAALADQARSSLSVALCQPYAGFQPLWAATFTPRQRRALSAPAVARDLQTLAACRWVEWVGLGQPFGFLGIDAAGHPSWLQLSLASDAASQAADAVTAGMPPATIADVARGRSLCDLALQTALGTPQRARCVPCFHLGDDTSVLAAWRPIPCDPHLAQALSLDDWRLSTGE